MRLTAPILLGAAAALLVVVLTARKAAAAPEPSQLWTETVTGWVDRLTNWQDQADNERRWRPTIEQAERNHGLPAGLLARLLYQESRYRTDIITGVTKSSAGAIGIAQFLPSTAAEMGVNPYDPNQAIPGAARYLRRLYDRFGEWRLAIAAYNWGQGNQNRDLRDGIIGNEWPEETVKYVAEISADVGLA